MLEKIYQSYDYEEIISLTYSPETTQVDFDKFISFYIAKHCDIKFLKK